MNADIDVGTNLILNVLEGVAGTDGVNLNQVTTIATAVATSVATTLLGEGTPTSTGDPITINFIEVNGSQGTMTRTVYDLNTLSSGLINQFTGLTVFLDGVIQEPSTYIISDTTTVTFSESLENSTQLLFIYGDISPTPVFNNVNATLTETATVASAGQTVFTAPTYILGANQLMVTIDGLLQSITQGNYTETTTTTLTLDEAMVGGEDIVVRNITGV
jgi:archaellum component FlaG (FlaF/FlaG flagellin family)